MTDHAEANEQAFQRTAWMVVGTLILALFVPPLTCRGMTWDGVLYATISRNMAAGICGAWHPMVTATFMRNFHEHPPLAFWLEASFFQVFGDHFWVERLYSLTTGLITGAILIAIWRCLLRDDSRARASSWLPIILWVACCHWSYRHNILENTLGMFTALSVYATLRALGSARGWASWSVLSGLAITAALLSKGPVGLFPAAIPAIAWFALRRTSASKAALVQVCVVCSCSLSFGLALVPEVARDYFGTYWHQQVVASLTGRREGVRSVVGQLQILLILARYLLVAGVIAGAVTLLGRRRNEAAPRDPRLAGPTWFCLLTALSASLPLVFSPKQYGHYTAPSWPFYAFALALWCLPAMLALLPRLAWVAQARTGALLRCGIAAVIVFTLIYTGAQYGRVFRDQPIIRMSNQIARATGPRATVVVLPDSWNQLADHEQLRLHAYLYRDHCISLWAEEHFPERIPGHLRLEAPDMCMAVSYEQIVTDSGLQCYPVLARPTEFSAGRPRLMR